jgi:hypothetical protein
LNATWTHRKSHPIEHHVTAKPGLQIHTRYVLCS